MQRRDPIRYAILIYPDVEPIDIGATFGVLSMAKRIAPDIEMFGVAKTAGPLVCANGLQVIADYSFSSAPDTDELIVTGGPGWQAASQDPETLAYIRRFNDRADSRLSSICTGAMILNAAGILDGQAVTTKSEVFDGETAPLSLLEAAGANVVSSSIVESGRYLTSGGVTLGIDAIFHILGRNHGQDCADEVARVMEYDRALSANQTAKPSLFRT